jgi:hypothetical protein
MPVLPAAILPRKRQDALFSPAGSLSSAKTQELAAIELSAITTNGKIA